MSPTRTSRPVKAPERASGAMIVGTGFAGLHSVHTTPDGTAPSGPGRGRTSGSGCRTGEHLASAGSPGRAT